METKVKTQQEMEQEILDMNAQFAEFLHTKGIKAKFKLAFCSMAESAKRQHEADVAAFEAVKAQSAEENKEFVEFLKTKGLKAKFRVVVEGFKSSAKAAPAAAAAHIAAVRAETQMAVARANALGKPAAEPTEVSAAMLQEQFNEFLKSKGLDGQYTVSVTED